MKRLAFAFMLFTVLSSLAPRLAAGQTPQDDERRALRDRIEERFDVVPLTDGLALRPKSGDKDVRLIEIENGAVLINGTPVTGSELRSRIGDDADAVLRLSYLSNDERRALVRPSGAEKPELAIEEPRGDERERPQRWNTRDRVRIFGDVDVPAGQAVDGEVVAVMGSVRIDGEVRQHVVAVMGSVELGPNAIVHDDVVSVGGRVHRAPGAQVRGAVTEVAFGEPNVHLNFQPLFGWRGPFEPFAAVPRLIGTTFRFLLLVLLVSIALVIARPTVDASAQRVADRPIQTTMIGMLAQVLLIPTLVLTCILLVVSIIGIPLLLLVPFLLIALLLLALAGFSGTVVAVGQWTRRRLGIAVAAPFVDVVIGLVMILLPVILGRLIALTGWPGTPLAFVLLALGFVVELVAWSSGFGAVLSNTMARWRARRAARVV